jgi:outer membrane protein assembly factor BamE (lipoprotein component of BamABCDE complex)
VEPEPTSIDRITEGMSQGEVSELLGKPLKVFGDAPGESSWMYRDRRQSGGHIYIYFDDDGWVTRIQGSVSFGEPLG